MNNTLNVVTAVTRPENIKIIAKHIPPWVRWWLFFKSYEDVRDDMMPEVFACAYAPGHLGESRNIALSRISDGYIWFLDDDNLPHPDFFGKAREWVECPGRVYCFDCDYGRRIGTLKAKVPPQPCRIDTAQCLFDRAVVGELQFDAPPQEDGRFYARLYEQNPEAWTVVSETLCHHNKLVRK